MKPYSSSTAVIVAVFSMLLVTSARAQRTHSEDFGSARRKFQWIERNGESATPSTAPTVLTAREWNAYLNEGGVKLPEGISRIHITTERGIAHGEAEIDFDQLTANRTRGNPLLFLFTGKHQVNINAHLQAANGIGTVHVDSVFFDGVEIPRLALEYFASRYLRPKYGDAVGLDSKFALHHRIDTAIVGNNEVAITQR
jgi:hypothetical protein